MPENKLISTLRERGNLSERSLKALFRALSKRTHPDSGVKSSKAFIELRAEYEEALVLIKKGEIPEKTVGVPSERNADDIRNQLLTDLLLFCMKIFTKESDRILLRMIETASFYKPGLSHSLKNYKESMYDRRADWLKDGKVYYAHTMLPACARQLFIFYLNRWDRTKKVLLAYLEQSYLRLAEIDRTYADALKPLFDWIGEEIDNKPVKRP